MSRIHPATAKCPEPLCPARELPPPGWPQRATSKGVTPSSSLIRAHAPDQIPPAAFVPSLAGLCRLLPAPCWRWSFPTLSLRTFPWVLGPVPRQPGRCTCPFLPVRHRPSPPPDYGSATATLRSKQLHADAGFEHVVIRNLQAPKFARHPGCPHQLRPSSARRRWLLRPGRTRVVTFPCTGYANRPIWAIAGMRTYTSLRTQPCRLLPGAVHRDCTCAGGSSRRRVPRRTARAW